MDPFPKNITSRDVFAARKNGKLDQAYELACTLMNKSPNDEWNRKAYAWTLIDLCKANRTNSERLNEFLQELSALQIDNSDEILYKQYCYVKDFTNQIKQKVKEASVLSKAGSHREALTILSNLNKAEFDKSDNETYAWTIYAAIKSGFYSQIGTFKRALFEYIKLPLDRPSTLHSLILFQVLNILKERFTDDFNLLAFLKLWDVNNFTKEDYSRKQFTTKDGKKGEYPSLVENTLKATTKYLLDMSKIDLDISWFLDFLNKVVKEGKSEWLTRDYALLLNKLNRKNEAEQIYKSLLADLGDKSYFWEEFGDIVRDINKDLAKSMYIKALSLNKDDYTINIRLKLATLLNELNEKELAKFELDKYLNHKRFKGHTINGKAISLEKELLDTNVTNIFSKNIIRNVDTIIDKYLYKDVPWVDCIYTHSSSSINENTHKKIIKFWFTDFNNLFFSIKSQKFGYEPKLYSCFRFKLLENINKNVRIIAYEKSTKNIEEYKIGSAYNKKTGNIKLTCKVEGKNIRYRDITDKTIEPAFGFVDNIYISKDIIKKLEIDENDLLTVIATKDKKTGKDKAIYVKKVN